MNRKIKAVDHGHVGAPHMRGDEPIIERKKLSTGMCSPHAWG